MDNRGSLATALSSLLVAQFYPTRTSKEATIHRMSRLPGCHRLLTEKLGESFSQQSFRKQKPVNFLNVPSGVCTAFLRAFETETILSQTFLPQMLAWSQLCWTHLKMKDKDSHLGNLGVPGACHYPRRHKDSALRSTSPPQVASLPAPWL